MKEKVKENERDNNVCGEKMMMVMKEEKGKRGGRVKAHRKKMK